MALKKRTEIHQDTVEFDKYIHSNSDNFFKILTKSNLKNGVNSAELVSVIKEIKKTVIGAVQNEINFFLSLENELIAQVNKKGQNFTRSTYLEELRKVRLLFAENSEYSAFIFNDLKENLGKIDSVKKYQQAVKKEVIQPISRKKFEEAAKKQNKNITKEEIQISWDSYLSNINKEIDKQKSDFQSLIDNIEKETAQVKTIIIERFAELINYISSVYDPTTNKAKDPTLDKISITSAKAIVELAKSFGLEYNPGDSLEKVLEDFKKELLELGSEEFFRSFYSAVGVQYYDRYVQAFQFESRMGFLYELAIRDSIIKLIQESHSLAAIFLSTSDIRTLGASEATKTNPIDLSIASLQKNGRQVFLGLSLKLKDDPTIKLENTNVADYIWKGEEIMGVSKEAYTYIKRNLKALNTFDNNNNSGTLDALTKDFLIFEKEFVVLTIMNRWLAGLFKKIGENQYRSVDKEGMDSFTEDLYTAFIYDAHDVYSVADVLQGILNVIADDKKDMGTAIGVNLSGPFGSVSTATNLDASIFRYKSTSDLKKLYDSKIALFTSLSEITYGLIMADSGISSVIKAMDSELNELTFNKATLNLNVNNIKKIVGGL